MAIRKLLDEDTGERIEIDVQTSEEKNRNRNWYELNKRKTDHEKLVGSFTFTLISTVKELSADERFTDDEKVRLMFLGTYVNYQGDEFSRLQKRNGIPILKKHLQDLLIMANNKRFYAFYNKLIEHQIILEVPAGKGTVELYWSSKYHFKGSPTKVDRKSKNLIKLYDNQLRELYLSKDEKGRQKYRPSNLYVLFTLMPFINYETNLISRDADKPASETTPLQLSEVAEVLNYSRPANLKRKLKGIKLHDAPIFSVITEGDREYIRVNPFIVWRNTENPSSGIIATFKATEDYLKLKIQARTSQCCGRVAAQ